MPLPDYIDPMLAQSCAEPFDDPRWLFEIKWDGTRCLAFRDADRLRLLNRREIEMRLRYPELACLMGLPPETVLDGEVVVLDAGKPSFHKLAQREQTQEPRRIAMLMQRLPATMLAFDLLYLGGECWMDRPLRERRLKLAEVTARLASPHVIAADFIVERGRPYFAAAERHGLEGIMAKRLDSPYLPGKRAPHWLKIKVARTEVFQVLGFVQRDGGEPFVRALAVGEPVGRRWTFKANVGSGFTEPQRAALYAELRDLPPLERPPKDGPKEVIWKATKRRANVRYFEKTPTGKLRAPVFCGFVE